jgi:hypothetical protein
MGTLPEVATGGLDPETFASEVDRFREAVANPEQTPKELERAFRSIVTHAALLDPRAAGFADAGMSLKAALCAWLDVAPLAAPHQRSGDGH